jgi:hypothetical protein
VELPQAAVQLLHQDCSEQGVVQMLLTSIKNLWYEWRSKQ